LVHLHRVTGAGCCGSLAVAIPTRAAAAPRRGRRMGQKETAMTGKKRPMIFD